MSSSLDVEVRHGAQRRSGGSSTRGRRRPRAAARAPRRVSGRAARRSSWTKFVSTRSSSTGKPGLVPAPRRADGRARGRPRAARRGGRARRAPAAATIPACRIAPPKRCFSRQARSISSARAGEERAQRAAEPLREAERDRVEARRRSRPASTPSATAALKRRAPSRWTREPRSSRAAATTASSSSSGQTRPPRAVVRVLEREHGRRLVDGLRRTGTRRAPARA